MKLSVRLSLVVVVPLAIMGVLLALLISNQISKSQRQEHDRWSTSFASALAKAVFRDTLTGKRAEVIAALQRSMRNNPEISYLMVVDFYGKVFAEVSRLKQAIPVSLINHAGDRHDDDKKYRVDNMTIRDEVYPLVENLPANLHVGFNTAYVDRNLSNITRTVLVSTGLLLLITIVIATLMATRISRPIMQLAASLRNYGRDAQLPLEKIKAKDGEVRDLVESFYAMTEQNDQALQALRAERNFNDSVLDTANALVVILDADGRIFRFNNACERLSGFSAEEIEGKFPWDTVLPPDEAEDVRTQAFNALYNNPDALIGNYTNHWINKSGDRFLIDWHNSVLRNKEGDLEFVVAVGTDITDEHAMREALRDERNFSNAVLENASALVVVFDRDARIIRFNHACEDISGYTEEEIKGCFPWDTVIPTEQSDTVRIQTYEAFKNNPDILNASYTNYWVNKNGKKFMIEWRNSVLRNNEGELDFVVSVGTDVTVERAMQEELRDERNFNDAVLDNAGALVVVHDRNARILRFNRFCEKVSGYSAQEVLGLFPWEMPFAPDKGIRFRTHFYKKVQENPQAEFGSYINYWQSKSGKRVVIEWNFTTLCNNEGALEYLISLGTDVTEKQLMEDALRESEARARAVFEQAAVGIAYVSPDGRWLDVNNKLCDILGYERSYMLSTTFQTITYADDLDLDLDYVEKMLGNEIQIYTLEKRYIKADGSIFWASLTVSLVRDERDDPLYFIAVIQDIHERKETEQLLRNSERQLVEAQRITHIGSWELDLLENKLHWSAEIFNIFEIDPSQFDASYEAFLNAIHPEDRHLVNKAYTASLETQKPYEISHRLLMADGRIKWVNERCETDFAQNGTALRSLGTVQDITEQVRNELELRDLNASLEKRVSERTVELESERNFIRTILDTASALVMVLDTEGRVVQINRACEDLSGYTEDEMLGQVPWKILVAEDQQYLVQQTFDELMRDGEPSTYELEWYCKDGDQRLIAWSNSTIKNHKGEIVFIIETGIDITERKAAEKALVQARDRAVQASMAKSDFLSRMSHELRTPLNAILGFSQLLKTDTQIPLHRVQSESVNEILQAGNHLLSLINEILDMSRIESGQLQLNIESVEVMPNLQESVSLVQSLAKQDGISIRLDPVPTEARWVEADAMRLKQVLLNLLSNAVKYNKPNGHIQIRSDAIDATQVRISISDSGDGISLEQQALLFEPFERLDADRKAIPGTGIGLALSKRLVGLMGGSMGVESEVGKGSTFWVQLRAIPG